MKKRNYTYYESTENGEIYQCKSCSSFHIKFGTTAVKLSVSQFHSLTNILHTQESIYYSNPSKIPETVAVPLLEHRIFMQLNPGEFFEFKSLVHNIWQKFVGDYKLQYNVNIEKHLRSQLKMTLKN
jgi:hypothetical protein